MQCWCSNLLNEVKAGKALPATSCNYKCSGDSKATQCGGSWAITLYSYKAPPLPRDWTIQSTCVADKSSRLLSVRIANGNTVTATSCVASCDLKGYEYAGVEGGRECWCGNFLEIAGGAGKSVNVCNMACLGDLMQV